MALSDYEKQVLAQLEQQLRDDDPELGSSFDESKQQMEAETGSSEPLGSKLNTSPRIMGISVMAVIVGLVLLIAGVATFHKIMIAGIALAVLGFLSMLFAVTLPMNKKLAARFGGPKNKADDMKPAQEPKREKKTFMERQEDKWDKRHGM